MPQNQTSKRTAWPEWLISASLSVALVLLASSILLTVYSAISDPDEFVHGTQVIGTLRFVLALIAIPFFLVIVWVPEGHEGTSFQGVAILANFCLIFISFVGFFLPMILGQWSQGAISRHLREIDLYGSVAAWSAGGEQAAENIDLASLSPVRSAVIVNGSSFDFQGLSVRISEFDDLLPNSARAYGTRNLRYVVILDEVPAGETLSAKWEAYYQRGWDVSKPAPVRYVHIDWHVALVDLVSQQVLTTAILSAEPPSEFRAPLDSKVEIRPSEGALEKWLGFE